MKQLFLLLGLIVLPLNSTWAAEPFAVVELFASEGCSSCPPADDLLSKLTTEAQTQRKRVFTLSFQVDYWNGLGWKDPFSSNQFTQRQYQYANVLQTSSVYTPQLIINANQVFVGSDENRARKEIDRALTIKSPMDLSLNVKPDEGQKIIIQYQASLEDQLLSVNFALVKKSTESHVTAGENAGRALRHSNVVLEFKSVDLKQKQGEVSFEHLKDKDQLMVIGFIQDKVGMKIFAADQIVL